MLLLVRKLVLLLVRERQQLVQALVQAQALLLFYRKQPEQRQQ